MVLKSSIRTSASPRRQRSHWGLRVTQDAYFSLLTHTKQLLLVTFCDTLAGIEVSFWADGTGRMNGWTDGWTDRRGSRNSYLDSSKKIIRYSNRIQGEDSFATGLRLEDQTIQAILLHTSYKL